MNLKNKLMKLHTVAGWGSWRVSVAHCRLQELEESRPNPKLLWLDKSKSQIIQSPSLYLLVVPYVWVSQYRVCMNKVVKTGA